MKMVTPRLAMNSVRSKSPSWDPVRLSGMGYIERESTHTRLARGFRFPHSWIEGLVPEVHFET